MEYGFGIIYLIFYPGAKRPRGALTSSLGFEKQNHAFAEFLAHFCE